LRSCCVSLWAAEALSIPMPARLRGSKMRGQAVSSFFTSSAFLKPVSRGVVGCARFTGVAVSSRMRATVDGLFNCFIRHAATAAARGVEKLVP